MTKNIGFLICVNLTSHCGMDAHQSIFIKSIFAGTLKYIHLIQIYSHLGHANLSNRHYCSFKTFISWSGAFNFLLLGKPFLCIINVSMNYSCKNIREVKYTNHLYKFEKIAAGSDFLQDKVNQLSIM